MLNLLNFSHNLLQLAMQRIFIIVFLCFILIPCSSAATPLGLADSALVCYQQKDYNQASLLYAQLLILHPKDFNYSYYRGMCLYQLNSGAPEAYQLLKFASTRNVPSDVYYSLGQTCMRLCRFDEALAAFDKAFLFGKKAGSGTLSAQRWKEMAMNAKRRTTRWQEMLVYSADTVVADSVPAMLAKHWGIRYFERGDELLTDFEQENSDGQRIAYCTNQDCSTTYFSGVGERTQGEEIWYAQKLANGNWGSPKHAGNIINTLYNEGFAWYNFSRSQLYFTSQGHSSIGGLDVFVSRYDAARDSWSLPVALEFPVNSPDDELAFFGLNDSLSVVVTNRGCQLGKVLVVAFANKGLPAEKGLTTPDDLFISSQLSRAVGPNSQPSVPDKVSESKVSTPAKRSGPAEGSDSYRVTLMEAMRYKTLADSLRTLVQQQKFAQKQETDAVRKKALTDQISRTEAAAAQHEALASTRFAQARAMETDGTAGLPTQAELQSPVPTTVKPSDLEQPKVVVQNEFAILEKSPYSADKPIPATFVPASGLVYRIQLGAFRQTVEPARFGGISPIDKEYDERAGVTKYYAGFFYDYATAADALGRTRTAGQQGAFLIALYNGKNISIKRAREIEGGN